MKPYVSLITLAVHDVEVATRFYRDGLGWPQSPASAPEASFFQCGPNVLSLYRVDAFSKDLGLAAPPDSGPRHALAHNVPSREDVDTILSEAKAAGASRIVTASETPWGGYVGYFADPDGHTWEIAWNPGFQLHADGSVTLPA